MGNRHRELWRMLERGLSGEAVARIIINEAERQLRDEPPLWTDSEIERMKRPLAHDMKARHAYARVIKRWCQANGIEMSLEAIDPPTDVEMIVSIRWYCLREFEDGRPPPRDPEQAFEACCAWLPSQGSMPIPTREGFLRLYPNERAYFAMHAREPAEPTA
jgi:hypothetical protein